MSKEQIKKIFEQLATHEERIGVLENVEGKKKASGIRPVAKVQKQSKGKAEDLHLPIQQLIQKDFFKDAKIDLDVVNELQKKLLTRKKPLRASVVNVLRTMIRNDVLERVDVVIGKKTLIAYKKA
ncbi:MAG: hypothetical protein M3Q34_03950 [bacterium]|nr:hypothetical protein [bacterium]